VRPIVMAAAVNYQSQTTSNISNYFPTAAVAALNGDLVRSTRCEPLRSPPQGDDLDAQAIDASVAPSPRARSTATERSGLWVAPSGASGARPPRNSPRFTSIDQDSGPSGESLWHAGYFRLSSA